MPRPENPRECCPPGTTPQTRHEEKRTVALMFLGVFGVTINRLLIQALGVQSDSFPRRLVRESLIAEHRIVGYPNKLYTLTSTGKAVAEAHLQRKVRLVRGDKLSTSQLSHDLMTQASVLDSLNKLAERSSATVDLQAFLRHARESKDLGSFDKVARPDLLYLSNGVGISWEVENSQKSSEAIKCKGHMLLRSSAQFNKLTVFWAIRGGSAVVDRYRECWEQVIEEAFLDGISRKELARVTCIFTSTTSLHGLR